MLYIAQLTLGLGTGSLGTCSFSHSIVSCFKILGCEGVTRSYVVEQAAPRVRTYMLARLSALQYAGFAATPLCGSAVIILRDISSIIISTKLVVNTNSWWWLARQSQIFGNLRCRRISSLL